LDLLDQVSKKALTVCVSITVHEKSKTLNINDCLNHFKLTEKLDKNNEWYCWLHMQKASKRIQKIRIILNSKKFNLASKKI